MILDDLVLLAVIALVATLFWQHLGMGQRAFYAAKAYTDAQGLTLLDQSVVLKRLGLRKSNYALFALERCYSFEFCSIGDERYPGSITFVGKRQTHVELAPYKTAEQAEPLTNEATIADNYGRSRCCK